MAGPRITHLRRPFRALALALIVGLGLAVLTGCGDGESTRPSEQPAATEAAHGDGPAGGHVHGLAVHDGTIFLATHEGLWSGGRDADRLVRVGDRTDDLMGLTLGAAGRLLASGHSGATQQGHGNLGLIESADGGRTWEPVSLAGEADFHALAARGRRVYGFDGSAGRLMASGDGGRTWEESTQEFGILSVAPEPGAGGRLVASTEQGIAETRDAGRTWRVLRNDAAGLLVWPEPGRMYLVDATGAVRRSADGGRSWTPLGEVAGEPAGFAVDDGDLYVARADGTVVRSTDGGRTFGARARA